MTESELAYALTEIRTEFYRAEKHPPFRSLHEGLAVLWEEFEEAKQEVFKKVPDRANLHKELVQVAAMAIKMLETI